MMDWLKRLLRPKPRTAVVGVEVRESDRGRWRWAGYAADGTCVAVSPTSWATRGKAADHALVVFPRCKVALMAADGKGATAS